jgi:hypothetical protein
MHQRPAKSSRASIGSSARHSFWKNPGFKLRARNDAPPSLDRHPNDAVLGNRLIARGPSRLVVLADVSADALFVADVVLPALLFSSVRVAILTVVAAFALALRVKASGAASTGVGFHADTHTSSMLNRGRISRGNARHIDPHPRGVGISPSCVDFAELFVRPK